MTAVVGANWPSPIRRRCSPYDRNPDRVADVGGLRTCSAGGRAADARATGPRAVAVLPLVGVRRRAAGPGAVARGQRLTLDRLTVDRGRRSCWARQVGASPW